MCAYVLSKCNIIGGKVIFKLIVLSLMFSTAVTAIPNYLIISKLGLMDNYGAIILPAFASSLGLYLMKQFIDSMIPNTILEAAKVDGANHFKMYADIVMPMVKPAWLTLIVFSFQALWNTGGGIYIRSEKLKTLNYAIGQIVSAGIARAGAGAAAIVLMMLLPIIVFVATQSRVVETMATSGIKE